MKTLIFFNNKGGVAKSSSATAIAHILAERYGKKVLVVDLDPQMNNRAYKNFLEKRDRTIDPRIKIKKRSDPQYIRRDVLVNDYIVKDLYIEMKEVAKENECSVGCVLYAALVSYIAAMDIFLQ